MKVTPTWRYWVPGERCFDINADDFATCKKPHWMLEARCEPWDGESFGKTPKELGFKEGITARDPEYWDVKPMDYMHG